MMPQGANAWCAALLCYQDEVAPERKCILSQREESSPAKAGDMDARGWGVAWVGAGLEESLSTWPGEAAVTAA